MPAAIETVSDPVFYPVPVADRSAGDGASALLISALFVLGIVLAGSLAILLLPRRDEPELEPADR